VQTGTNDMFAYRICVAGHLGLARFGPAAFFRTLQSRRSEGCADQGKEILGRTIRASVNRSSGVMVQKLKSGVMPTTEGHWD